MKVGQSPIERAVQTVLERNANKWTQAWQSPANRNLRPEEAWKVLDQRYIMIRREIASVLVPQSGLYIDDIQMVFPTQNDLFKNSQIDAQYLNLKWVGVNAGDRIVDLGVGMGEALFTAALFPGTKVDGYELNPILSQCSRLLQAINSDLPGVRSANIMTGDFLAADLKRYNVYLAYLTPKLLASTFEKLTQEAEMGALVISSHPTEAPPACWQFDNFKYAYVKNA